MTRLKIEIAKSRFEKEQGLMHRHSLDDDSGMLFDFDTPQVLNFWGVNTFIPLDIAFVDQNGIIQKISCISPHDKSIVSSETDCNLAIEANIDFFAKNGIEEGDRIRIENQDRECYVLFDKNKGKDIENLKISYNESDNNKWFQEVITAGLRPRCW